MPTVNVYNMAGQVTGTIELSESVFGIEPNTDAIHASVKRYLANQRQGTQSALTRAEVSGGGKKPLRQKGTGNARQGSTRAPHYTHGGIAFAPKPRDYGYEINRKLTRLAIKSALSQKVLDGALIVVDAIEMNEIKTKNFAKFLNAVNYGGKSLVVTPAVNGNVVKSAANIPGVKTTIASILCAYDIMNANTFIVDKAAISKIEEVYA